MSFSTGSKLYRLFLVLSDLEVVGSDSVIPYTTTLNFLSKAVGPLLEVS